MEEQKFFDATKPFTVEIQSGGIRRADLNYPTDAQWVKRTTAAKTIRTDIGRGRSRKTDVQIEAHDLILFNDRKISTSDEFDEYEASAAINVLAKAEITHAEMLSDKITIGMVVFGGAEIEFEFKLPRRKHIVEFIRDSFTTVNTPKGSESVTSIEPAGRLYDQLVISATGYAPETPVPITHKEAAMAELYRIQNPE